MKHSFLLKSGFYILMAASLSTPLSTLADEQGKTGSDRITYTYGEMPTVYANAGEESVRSERGAMGPKASDRMEGVAASQHRSGESPTQYRWWEFEKTGHGAQGPIRNESMSDGGGSRYHYYGEMPTQYDQ